MNSVCRPIRLPAALRAVFVSSALGMAMAGCSLFEIAPVDDGSYLAYSVTDLFGGNYPCTLHFKRAQRGLLEVTVEQPSVKVSGDDGQLPVHAAFQARAARTSRGYGRTALGKSFRRRRRSGS
jgi:hypothetical protein